ncbi:hypothetical protein QVD99_006121 [Batrachochytrium dendrobatidis]|nr:hypothetical protein O5D80_006308 [Batrachochytrium dendrobatidis]KAK5667532.1 hypothetical protein QVD99_006121 [Batrachochytrium dendrobatidis]
MTVSNLTSSTASVRSQKQTESARSKSIHTTPPDYKPHLKGAYASLEVALSWTPPPFTLKDIRNAIPGHCFKRNTMRSIGYVVHDAILLAVLFFAATYIPLLPVVLQIVSWPLYWLAQGSVGFGVWILAHECGHGSFSPSTTINNIFGWVMHSIVLVPYFSWKYTHSKHHKGTGHMEKDEAFVPEVRSSMNYSEDSKTTQKSETHVHQESFIEDAPIVQLAGLLSMLIFGWPVYLLTHYTGQTYPGWVNHFNPYAKIFTEKNQIYILLSDLGIFLVLGAAYYACTIFGYLNVFMYYVMPYLVVNFWLVTITFLQHTDPLVPHYRNGEWDFMRGALATVDRDFGIFNHFHHHISDTHVVHHLFSTMPHYHAQEATEAVKEFLGKYYLYDSTPFMVALYRNYKLCKFVEDDGDIVFFKH